MIQHCILFAAALIGASPSTSVYTIDGQRFVGRLVSIDAKAIELEVDGKPISVPSQLLDRAVLNDNAVLPKTKVQLAFEDGTLLVGSAATTAGTQGTLERIDGSQQRFDASGVTSIRLGESTGLEQAWQEIAEDRATADRLVVRRVGEDRSVSLDVMEGIAGDVTNTNVAFKLGGDPLKVKLEKVAGVLYFRRAKNALPPPICVVQDIDGARLPAAKLTLSAGDLKITTPASLELSLPQDRVRQIDFASINQRYLSDIRFENVARESWFESSAVSDKGALKSFAVQLDRTPSGPLMVGGELIPKGVWMPAVSTLVLDVPTGFKKLVLRLGVDDHVGTTDGAKIVVEGDGKKLFEEEIVRSARPEKLSIDLAGAKRIRIRTDFGGESKVGDQIVLCEAKFVK